LKAGKNLKFETVKDLSAINAEKINDNVQYIQGILLLSACKGIHKIQIIYIFFEKKTFFALIHIFYICGIQIIILILRVAISRKIIM